MNKKILFALILGILLIGIVSAEINFDNVKYYTSDTETAAIKNFFGLGRDLASVKLETPSVYNVIAGEDRLVAEMTFNNLEDYNDVFNNMQFLDLKKGNKEIQREFKYKEKIFIENKEIAINDCTEILNNQSICKISYITQPQYDWREITKENGLTKGIVTIGIFTDVLPGDKIEWIPTFYGVKINEWAIWSEGLLNNLTAEFGFDKGNSSFTTADNNASIIANLSGVYPQITGWTGDGKIRSAIFFNITDTDVNISNYEVMNFTSLRPWSLEIWKNIDASTDRYFFSRSNPLDGSVHVSARSYTSNDIIFEMWEGSADGIGIRVDMTGVPQTNNYTQIVFVYDGTRAASGVRVYVNNVSKSFSTLQNSLGGEIPYGSNTNTYIGNYPGSGSASVRGSIDIVRYFTTNLTENHISNLWNNSYGILNIPNIPNVNLVSPQNYFNTSSNSVLFNCSANSSVYKITNVSLWINGQNNYTLQDGLDSYTSLQISRDMAQGLYNWTCSAEDNISQMSFAESNRTLKIDSNAPSVNITSILNTTYTTTYTNSNSINISLNFSASDSFGLGSCWYYNQSANVSITCGNNASVILPYGAYRFYFYANDSVGNESSYGISANWNYKVLETSRVFNNITTEGATEIFRLNISISSVYQVSTIRLNYNSTNYSSTFSLDSNDVSAYNSIAIPNKDVSSIIPFYWIITLTDGSTISTNPSNQTVNVIQLDDCSTYTTLIYNYTINDEETKLKLQNTTAELQVNMYDSGRTLLIVNFSKAYNNTNPIRVCFNGALLTTINYSVDSVIKYTANVSNNNETGTEYAIEYYNILSQVITNTTIPKNINLYDLVKSKTTDFQLTYKDVNLAFAPNILVNVYRQYISDNDFKVVEIPLTDANGQTVLHLVRNDVVYNFVMVNASGDIVATFNKIIAFCQDFTIGSCSINLNAVSGTDVLYNYVDDIDMSYTDPTYSNSTNEVSFTFISNNLSTITVTEEVIRNNQFGNRSVCTDVVTSSTGTLSCDVSSITTTDRFLFVNIYVNNEIKASTIIDLEHNNTGGFGIVNGAFYGFLFLLLIICFFMDDKQVLVIALGIGWAIIIGLSLINGALIGALSAGIWLIVCIIIFIVKLKKEETGQ